MFAQNIQKYIDDLSKKMDAAITINKNSGVAEFIIFPQNQPLELEGSSVYNKALSFLETYKGIFDLKSVDDSFVLETIKTDNYGFKHVTL
jgi:bacillolysin